MNNTFSFSRFIKLCKQQLFLNSRLILFGLIGYCGTIFILMLPMRVSNSQNVFDVTNFLQVMTFFFIGFGVLYNGYSFKFLRTKESSISYLMIPASALEKFIFEFLNRVVLTIIALPTIFWIVFNLTGLFFNILDDIGYSFISINDIIETFEGEKDSALFFSFAIPVTFLILILPFTGSTIFTKQPLIKTLFSVTIICLCYAGVVYFLAETVGINQYTLNENGIITPMESAAVKNFFRSVLWLTNIVLLIVAFLKLKEKEV